MTHWRRRFDRVATWIEGAAKDGATVRDVAGQYGITAAAMRRKLVRGGRRDLVALLDANNPADFRYGRPDRSEEEKAQILQAVRDGIGNRLPACEVARQVGMTQAGLYKHMLGRGMADLYRELVDVARRRGSLEAGAVRRRLAVLRAHGYIVPEAAASMGMAPNTLHMFLRRMVLGKGSCGRMTRQDYVQLCEDFLDDE